ncbi:hypothetical protein [Mesorhizobium sp. 2RAF21]|uniref:hypothetical protein n=1 Tax=Mesorhizobium sp. 2RAF21 TaxID=3232995 RepID=UPI003F9DFB61
MTTIAHRSRYYATVIDERHLRKCIINFVPDNRPDAIIKMAYLFGLIATISIYITDEELRELAMSIKPFKDTSYSR